MGFGTWIRCRLSYTRRSRERTDARLIRIASRTFALDLFSWALLDGTYFSQFLLLLIHHLEESGLRDQNYWKDYYLIETASLVLRVAAASLTAIYLWNGGQRTMRLFLPAVEETPARGSSLDKTL
jgi:hypothetical protein